MNQTNDRIDEFVRKNWESIVSDIAELVAIPSVENKAEASESMPYGAGPAKALNATLGIAQRMGLKTYNYQHKIGYAELAGASNTYVATITHVDVVPAGQGWVSNPYKLERREGHLVGRGVLDDKGPAVLTLWAAKFLAECGAPLTKGVRILFGSNEETGMDGARTYVKDFPAPEFLFTPDGAWPVVCGEKGSYNAVLSYPVSVDGAIREISGGTVRNAVAAQATALIETSSVLTPTDEVSVKKIEDNVYKLVAQGVGGHASLPEHTKSALGILVNCLWDNQMFATVEERRWLEFERGLYSDTDGSFLGIACSDDKFSDLTIISGTMETKEGIVSQTLDCRFPKSTTPDDICIQIQKRCAEYGIAFEEVHRGACHYVSPEIPEVQTLMACYERWTGKNAEPITIGGGTYAKRFPCAVAFGPEDDEPLPEWAGPIHGPNEAVSEQKLQTALKIYISALLELATAE